MSKKQILVVDDEPDILEMVKYNLERDGFVVHTAAGGEDVVDICGKVEPDLIVLDLMLPGINGHQVCYQLKSDDRWKHIPILMLTAKTEETDEVVGLRIGADDYVKKPFSPRVLVARVHTILRRQTSAAAGDTTGEQIIRDELILDRKRHDVRLEGKPIRLTPIEFDILYFLARRPGWVYSRQQIIDEARGEDVYITERTVDVHIATLRKKLGSAYSVIETVHGIGYRFKGR